ncbi:MAG: DUF1861 family protein [Firmicutes bacterium]|nr:DUF1861 family protein [Bacillota bacterium]
MKQTCAQLLAEFTEQCPRLQSEKLEFTGVGNDDVYNITAPFMDDELVIAGRVEPRESERSRVVFFVARQGQWVPKPGAPTYDLQDPFVARIRGELIFGGVEVFPHPTVENALHWRTRFYRGDSIKNLVPFAQGPDGMKDIRLVELPDGDIGVFTRPQGEVGGRGTIGWLRIRDFNELTPEKIQSAQLLDQFIESEWGGVNEVHLLKGGLLGALGHIACFDDEGNRHYYPMTFALDPDTGRQVSPMKIIAARRYLAPGAAKRPDLEDVLFSGGLVRQDHDTATLYVGVSDAEAHRVMIPDPFQEYEV